MQTQTQNITNFWLIISCSRLINNYIRWYIIYVVDEDFHLVTSPKNRFGSPCSQWLLQVDLVPQGPFWFIAFPMATSLWQGTNIGNTMNQKSSNLMIYMCCFLTQRGGGLCMGLCMGLVGPKCERIEEPASTAISLQTQFLQFVWISSNKIHLKINIFHTLALKIVK